MSNIFNIVSKENGAKISTCSSQRSKYSVRNILVSDIKKKWITNIGLPQVVVIDISNLNYRPQKIECFGLQCNDTIPENPKKIEVFISANGISFTRLGEFEFFLKSELQFYIFEENAVDFENVNYVKIVIKETFGGEWTYLNNFYIFEHFQADDSQNNKTSHIGSTRNDNWDTLNNVKNFLTGSTTKTLSSAIGPNYNFNYLNNNSKASKNKSQQNTTGNLNTISNNNYLITPIEISEESLSYNNRKRETLEKRICTIENELFKIGTKIDTVLSTINNNTIGNRMTETNTRNVTGNCNNYCSIREGTKTLRKTRSYVKYLREQKLNITIDNLDKKINNFKLNLNDFNKGTKTLLKELNFNCSTKTKKISRMITQIQTNPSATEESRRQNLWSKKKNLFKL